MDTKLILVTLFCVFNTLIATEINDAIKLETGGRPDRVLRSIYNTMTNNRIDDTESSGSSGGGPDDENDNELYSGSGSGQVPTTVSIVTKADEGKSTPEIVDIHTAKSTPVTTIGDNVTLPKSTGDPTDDVGFTPEPEKAGVKFTIGIIVGVVVGAVLAILVIVFLVYRLRKKDEGSYSLDEQSSQAFIRDDKTGQGKEYFA